MKSPISGGIGAAAGSPEWNQHLSKLRPNIERTHKTSDPGTAGQDGYPSMYDLAKSLTDGKWGKSGK